MAGTVWRILIGTTWAARVEAIRSVYIMAREA